MLDTTKPIKLTRSYIDSRGNHYPPKDTAYLPGELPVAAWSYSYAIQETESPTPELVETVISELIPTETLVEITNPSNVKEIKPTQDALTPTQAKEIKSRVYKHTKTVKTDDTK